MEFGEGVREGVGERGPLLFSGQKLHRYNVHVPVVGSVDIALVIITS